jgi:glycosyltransferase involved in cell wall biosynthesis
MVRSRVVAWVRVALVRWARGGRRTKTPRVYILLLNAWGMGGTVRTTLNLAGYLARYHDVEILSLIRARDEPFFPLPPGVTITAIHDKRREALPVVLRPLRGLLSQRSSVLVTGADRRAGRAASLWTDIALVMALRGRREGVLISTRPALNLVSLSVAPESLVRVGQEHLNFAHHAPHIRRAIQRDYRRLDALVTLTERDLARYRRALGDTTRLAAIPNAAPDFGGIRSDGRAKRVIAVGRLTRQKGFARLIQAFAQAAADRPDWDLVICGEGPRRAHLERVIAGLDMERRVTLAGPVADVGSALAASSIFGLSSRVEGFPMVLLEAMAVGLPVVSFDCPTGPREIVENGRNGLLVRRGDVDAMAGALRTLIEDERLRQRCSDGALETVESYSQDAIGARWARLIEELYPALTVISARPAHAAAHLPARKEVP